MSSRPSFRITSASCNLLWFPLCLLVHSFSPFLLWIGSHCTPFLPSPSSPVPLRHSWSGLRGGLAPGHCPTKHVCHFLPQEGWIYDTIDPNAIIVPMKIINALEAGMHQFIPLSLLTRRACWEAMCMSSVDKVAKHALQLEGHAITVKAAIFDDSKESLLTPLLKSNLVTITVR